MEKSPDPAVGSVEFFADLVGIFFIDSAPTALIGGLPNFFRGGGQIREEEGEKVQYLPVRMRRMGESKRCCSSIGRRIHPPACRCRSIAACFILATTMVRGAQVERFSARAAGWSSSGILQGGSLKHRNNAAAAFSWPASGRDPQATTPRRTGRAPQACRGSKRLFALAVDSSSRPCVKREGLAVADISMRMPLGSGERPGWVLGMPHARTMATIARVARSGASPGVGEGDAEEETRVTVLVGGEERDLDERAMREAVQESGDDSMVTVRIEVKQKLGGKRLDALLSEKISILSRSSLSRIIKAEGVTINGKVPKPSTKLKAGDDILVNLPPPPSTDVEGEDIPLEVLHEDDQVILVNKQSDLVVHPAPTAPSGTLVNALVHHFKALGGVTGLSSVGSDKARPGIVHRLDRNTTGVMIVAKTEGAHWHLYEQFARRSTDKRYLALVHGNVSPSKGLIDLPLGRHPRDPTKFAVVAEGSGKPSQTEYIVRESYQGFTLVEVKLLTGRTHQIRAHLSHIKHPLVGDSTYGGKPLSVSDIVRPQQLSLDPTLRGNMVVLARQALHSCTLRFHHPDTDEHKTVLAPAPHDLVHSISLLRQHRLLEVTDAAKMGSTIPINAIIPLQEEEQEAQQE